MLLDKPLPCSCGKKPKLQKGSFNYVRYYCPDCKIGVFFSRKSEFCLEAWNAMVTRGLDKVVVKI